MKTKSITYSKLVNTGNFSNIKLGIKIELEDGDKEIDAMKRAKAFVQHELDKLQITDLEVQRAQRIVDNPRDYKIGEVEDAKLLLEKYNEDNLPF